MVARLMRGALLLSCTVAAGCGSGEQDSSATTLAPESYAAMREYASVSDGLGDELYGVDKARTLCERITGEPGSEVATIRSSCALLVSAAESVEALERCQREAATDLDKRKCGADLLEQLAAVAMDDAALAQKLSGQAGLGSGPCLSYLTESVQPNRRAAAEFGRIASTLRDRSVSPAELDAAENRLAIEVGRLERLDQGSELDRLRVCAPGGSA
ncbi:MAG TPA: hypothetical protein PKD63_02670 [Solirubrobacteraceae bacterium]|nr:hypothetical protein [Solirubrobacteraceae bacterium]